MSLRIRLYLAIGNVFVLVHRTAAGNYSAVLANAIRLAANLLSHDMLAAKQANANADAMTIAEFVAACQRFSLCKLRKG